MIETFKGRLSQHKNVDKLNCNLVAIKLLLIKQLMVQLMVLARGVASLSSLGPVRGKIVKFNPGLRWYYTGRFTTTIFRATQRCNAGTMLWPFETAMSQQCCNAVLRLKSSLQSSRVTSPLSQILSKVFLSKNRHSTRAYKIILSLYFETQ